MGSGDSFYSQQRFDSTAEGVVISCICPTYNRIATQPHLLEEAVGCFLSQTYENKELVILNDNPLQTILCEHPQIRIINHPMRFATLGEKYNYAIEQANGEFICPWEDDDLSLPHRLALSREKIGSANYFNPKAYFFSCGDTYRYEAGKGYAHNCSMFRKAAWKAVGGYPHTSGPQDAGMDGLLRSYGGVVDGPVQEEEAFYVYRWGVSELHLSGQGDTQKAYDEYASRATEKVTRRLHGRING